MRFLIALVLCFVSATAVAGLKAVTDEGDVVILNNDGTWHYENQDTAKGSNLELNPIDFTKPRGSTFEVKSTKTSSVFWIDPKMWMFKKITDSNEPHEYSFKKKDADLYGMVISEQLEADLIQLVNIAFENAKEAAPDVRIVKQEYRKVNGHRVIFMQMAGTIKSVKFTYLGYYYTDKSGATQYVVYTGTNLVDKYKKDIEGLLNGFDVRKN